MKQKSRNLKYLLFVNLFSLAGFYIFSPLYAIYAHSLDIDPKSISLIWSSYSLAMAIFILLFGKIENKSKKGKVAVCGYFVYAIGALAFLLVHNKMTLIAVLIFNALGSGITLPAYKTMFTKDQAKGRESEQWSWLDAGTQIAAAIGAAIGGIIIGLLGFKGIFVAMSLVQFVAAIVAYRTFYRHA